MNTKTMFELNVNRKKWEGIGTILTGAFILFIIILYVLFLKRLSIFQDSFLTAIVGHIKDNIAGFSVLGSFYIAMFGGLFFIFVPMEAYFVNALRNSSPLVLFILFILGIAISYSLDYLIGMKMSKISRKLVSPKKFYQIKAYLNRYGKLAIIGANIIPMAPSQQVTFILGVFRYNRMRLFVLTMAGQILKYLGIIFVVSRFL